MTYTCPMHPEVEQEQPGDCPKCGMALEPKTVTAGTDDEENAELRDMTRRLWIGAALALPVFVLAMSHLIPALARQSWVDSHASRWVQFALTTPVVLWAGGPFFYRGWRSVVTRHLNMFTLIAMGVSVAFLFPVFAKAREKARQASCVSNLKQIMNGAMMYTQDYDEKMVSSVNLWGTATVSNPWIVWPHQLQPYIKNWKVYACPSTEKGAMNGYWFMDYPTWPTYAVTNAIFYAPGVNMSQVQSPADKIFIADSNHPVLGNEQGWLTASACGQWVCGLNVNSTHAWLVPHSGGIGVGYIDGHVKWQKGDKLYSDILNGAANPTN